MDYLILAFSALSTIISIVVLAIVLKNKKTGDLTLGDEELKKVRGAVSESVENLSSTISNLVAEKNATLMSEVKSNVESMNKKIEGLVNSYSEMTRNDATFKQELIKLLNDNNSTQMTKFGEFVQKYIEDSGKQKDEIMTKLSQEIKSFNETVKDTLGDFDKSIKEKLEEFKNNTKDSIGDLNKTVSTNLSEIREDNNKKLEKINESVNEKLQKTLEEKLKDSFKSVVEGIGDVNKAVGEIKGLATDVGSLKTVLTNVKTKGIVGEVILGNIIREFLTNSQYEENVVTKKNSSERVEFAIKLPGTKDDTIFLPVDSKFPYEPYSIIQESTDPDIIREERKRLRTNLASYAKDVHDKYIDVPNTTEFAVIFLPLEGLFLEALNLGLFEELQNKYKVCLTGPTTFTAFINSLNMGFRSLMIQKKSAEVFKLLGAVKTEFGKFADALEKTQKKVDQAADELENLVGTRTRQINRQLKSVEELDEETTKMLLGETEIIN